jgi:hypothetical protein
LTGVDAVARTRDWLERVVIGLELCPFARRPFVADRISYRVCGASGWAEIYRELLGLVDAFWQADAGSAETALLIVPDGLEAFGDYLEILARLDAVLDDVGLRGHLQIASFHPDYVFDGAAVDDPANYSNRSPLPMFHLIREEALARAIDGFDGVEEVPRRNVRRLRALGLDAIRRIVAGQPVS